MTTFLAHRQRFDRVGSTNDIVRDWLAAGVPEVCLAVADEQTAGRGRAGRTWIAPRGSGLLLSLGFRPTWLDADRTWRLAAIVSIAMANAAEAVAGLADGTIRLKWPNDLVVETEAAAPGTAAPGTAATDATGTAATGDGNGIRKLAGVLGETYGLGSHDPGAVIGIGINTDWSGVDVPVELAEVLTSLGDVSGGRSIDRASLLAAFLERLEPGFEDLRGGRFDAEAWQRRQLTTGRLIRLEQSDDSRTVRSLGVDGATGALLVEDSTAPGGRRSVLVGEVGHVRLAGPVAAVV